MKRLRLSPIVRISIGLTLLTLSMLFTSTFVGVTPDPTARELDARKSIAETLAVQLTLQGKDLSSSIHRAIIATLVERNDQVVSVGLRANSGALLIDVGDHDARWRDIPLDQSTPMHAQVPMFEGNERWATLEIQFRPLEGLFGGIISPWFAQLIAFMGIGGFFGYWLFMRRTLKELDPSKVAPTRVQDAMDSLAEGVMMLDEQAQPILVNSALCAHLDRSRQELLAQSPSTLPWIDPATGRTPHSLPWHGALTHAEKLTGEALSIRVADGSPRAFVVNASPITDSAGRSRGALVTFDDITDIEEKNAELQKALRTLESTQSAIRQQNAELERLATRDPMTDCLNRRAFFEQFTLEIAKARKSKTALSCVMADIDHFKQVNDTHGHGVGDEVIILFAHILKDAVRSTDLVCRYGGEEFCILLPGLDATGTVAIAERIRERVKARAPEETSVNVRVTSSFGVAHLADDLGEPLDLVNRADEALYVAKESGRNRVVAWRPNGELVEELQEAQDRTAEITVLRDASQPTDSALSDENAALLQRVKELERALSRRTQALRREEGHDRITGLPNRLLFRDRCEQALQRARRNSASVAVLYMDVDTLRRVSDALGSRAGDRLLRFVSERLATAIRDTDTVTVMEGDSGKPTLSRLGDNDFGLLIADMESNDAVTWLVKRLFDALDGGCRIGGNEIAFGASIGVAVYPDDGRNADELLKNAAAARAHAAQQPGRRTYQFYSSDMNAHAFRQLKVEAELRRAIETDQLTLHFQPKFCLRSGDLTGVEALVRWIHPERGVIPPSDFIPVAERSGLISPLGHWVIRRACAWIDHWRGLGVADLRVAVNVSSQQFREPEFCTLVLAAVNERQLHPGVIELELTESSVMDNLEVATATIAELSGHGFSIAIDDFGTGYSSLSYLRSFPVDCLKIDRSFMNDLTRDGSADTLVATICAMAHKLGLRVVAEGVEHEDQIHRLRKHRCDEVQGFLFSPPVPGDEISAMATGALECATAIKRARTRWPFSRHATARRAHR